MPALFVLITGTVGFLIGSFFQFHILLWISAISCTVTFFLLATMKELAGLIAITFGIGSIIANATMYLTYYFSTNQTWVGDFLRQHILRG